MSKKIGLRSFVSFREAFRPLESALEGIFPTENTEKNNKIIWKSQSRQYFVFCCLPEFGWEPEIFFLEGKIRTTLRWHFGDEKKHFNGTKYEMGTPAKFLNILFATGHINKIINRNRDK